MKELDIHCLKSAILIVRICLFVKHVMSKVSVETVEVDHMLQGE